ncbi:MAG: shikimate kinase [Candidatus Omnitrophota bacterium]
MNNKKLNNIVLVGFMGTGKSTIAKALAGKTGKQYISIDGLIEDREQQKISDIFKEKGEPYFRKVEKQIVKEVMTAKDQIVDAGGGVVLDSENVDVLKKNGTVVCLWSDPGVILERTEKYSHRPLLAVSDPESRIKELLDQRRSFYEKADFHVDTTDGNIDRAVREIEKIKEYEQKVT